jgi:hypothetical protein
VEVVGGIGVDVMVKFGPKVVIAMEIEDRKCCI